MSQYIYTYMCNLAKRANETTRYDEKYWQRRKKEMEYTNARKCELCMRLTSWVKLLSTRMFSLKASDGNVSGEKWLNICMYGCRDHIIEWIFLSITDGYVDFCTLKIFSEILNFFKINHNNFSDFKFNISNGIYYMKLTHSIHYPFTVNIQHL